MDIRPGLTGLLAFLSFIQRKGFEYYILHTSPDDLTVCFTLPFHRVEVRFQETQVDWCMFDGDEGMEKNFTALIDLIDLQ